MSLYKQLWLAVILMLTLVFSGSFLVSSLSAKSYLEQQLYMKNSDNATALALSLTQQDADLVLLELTIAAQFDTGFYEMIELVGPEGQVTVRREDTQIVDDAPAWFMKILPIEVEPGVAQVQKGWQQLGTLSLRSHSRFAYRELWQSTQKMTLVFIVAMILACFLGSYLLKIILRPLDDVVDQAEAIGERRFISIPEPYTREFKQVVNAMNKLSHRIKEMLGQEAKRLEKWQREAHVDKVTGLLNREPFVQALDAALGSDDVNATGSLSLIRLGGLAQMNQVYGRRAIDSMLKDVGAALNLIVGGHNRWAASRLNGSDFALLAPRASEPADAAEEAQAAFREILESRSMLDENTTLPVAATIFSHGDTFGSLMTRLDAGLLAADKEGLSSINVVHKGDVQAKPVREQMEDWRAIFAQSFREQKFSLISFPVIGLEGTLLHNESPVRLEWEGDLLTAGQFLPWINRLEISGDLDKQVIELALKKIGETGLPICVNLSVASVVDDSFLPWISEQLSQHADAAGNLWLEVAESMAFRHLTNFKQLCTRAKAYKCKMGIEHMGHQLADLGKLHDVGVDYLKVDASFVRDIDNNVGNQTLLRTLCTLGHSIGVIVIAEGVRTAEEWATLQELGADGATGPAIEAPSTS
jgi:EAL domain-containing protein (putative c-di-GMP-specific phosphodiesterase class I)/GGDEF domain-containing protein